MQVHAMRCLFCPVLVAVLLAGCDGEALDLPLGPDSHDNADSSIAATSDVDVDVHVNIFPGDGALTPISGPPPPTDVPPGLPPVLSNPGPMTNTVGDVIDLQLTVSPGATLSGTNCPRDLAIGNTGRITGTISSSSADDPQPFTCTVTALLRGLATTTSWAWTILPAEG